MKKKNEFVEIAQTMLPLIGENNFTKITNCFSRVRISIKDPELVNEDEIKQLPLVKGITWSGNELQIIIGSESYKLKDAFEALNNNKVVGEFETKKQDETSQKKQSFWKRFLAAVNGIVVPILPVLMTSGMISGISAILISTGLIQEFPPDNKPFLTDMNWYSGLVYIANNSGITLLSIFFCYSTVKYFHGDGMMGILIGLVITSRYFLTIFEDGFLGSTQWDLFKIGELQISIKAYNNNIIPAVGAGLCYVLIDRSIKKWMPPTVDIIFRPLLSFVSVFIISFLLVMPLLSVLEFAISWLAKVFFSIPFGIGGALVGFFYLITILSGFGWPIGFALEEKFYHGLGPLMVVPLWDAVTLGYIGTMLALYFKEAKQKNKASSIASIPPLLFGVPEPALYGLLLERPKAFWLTNLGSGIVGLAMSLLNMTRPNIGGYGILGILGWGTDYKKIIIFVICSVMGILINFLLVYFFYNEKKSEISLVKESLNHLTKYVAIATKKEAKVNQTNQKISQKELKKETDDILLEVKKVKPLNDNFWKMYLSYSKILNKFLTKKQKFETKQNKLLAKIEKTKNQKRKESLELKLMKLKEKYYQDCELNNQLKNQKAVLDVKAAELELLNSIIFDSTKSIIHQFLVSHHADDYEQDFLNMFYNAINNNLITSDFLEPKQVNLTKENFYQTNNKMALKFLPKIS